MDPAANAAAAAQVASIVDATGAISSDVQCRRCGYNLRGLHHEGRCPECGTPVGRSLLGDLLKFSDPAWVKKVANGLNLIVIGAIFGILLGCILGGSSAATGANPDPILQIGVQLLAGVVGFIGTWMITSRDPSGLGEDKEVNARKIVRFTLIVGLFSIPLGFAHDLIQDRNIVLMIALVGGLLGLVSLVGEWYKFVYYEQLARRIPDELTARRARTVRWGFVICLGSGMVGGAFAAFASAAAPKSPGAIAVVVPCFAIMAIGLLVFGILAILLILRLRKKLIQEARFAAANWDTPLGPTS